MANLSIVKMIAIYRKRYGDVTEKLIQILFSRIAIVIG